MQKWAADNIALLSAWIPSKAIVAFADIGCSWSQAPRIGFARAKVYTLICRISCDIHGERGCRFWGCDRMVDHNIPETRLIQGHRQYLWVVARRIRCVCCPTCNTYSRGVNVNRTDVSTVSDCDFACILSWELLHCFSWCEGKNSIIKCSQCCSIHFDNQRVCSWGWRI